MLDRKSEELLRTIIDLSVEGRFNVISKKELAGSVADQGKLGGLIYELRAGGFIDVKYEDETQLCLAPTPKGRLFFESEPPRETKKYDPIVLSEHLLRFIEILAGVFAAVLILSALGVRL